MKMKFKSGATSFYVVAFSTLILAVIAASFATAIVAEITRTTNDDLSQSAYDAALAGVEDAKLALMNYQNCIKSGVKISEDYKPNPSSENDNTCENIIYWVQNPDCDMVAHILGRMKVDEGGEVLIEETTNGSNEMNQAYTCAMINMELPDYRASLSSSNPYKVVKVNLDDVKASDIKSVKVSWYSNPDNLDLNYTNVLGSSSMVAFQPLTNTNVATPPTLAVQLLQTGKEFSLKDLNGPANGETTDRAAVYLVPTDNEEVANNTEEIISEKNWNLNYIGVFYGDGDGGNNILSAKQIAKSNDRSKDLPYVVYCPSVSTNEYICSATLTLPNPVGGDRSDDTFVIIVSLPYGQPDTDFSLEFFCADGDYCGHPEVELGDDGEHQNYVAQLSGTQVEIDSTGRANDLYRRVKVRLESIDNANANALSLYAIQALGGKEETTIDKGSVVTREYGVDE